MATKTTKAKGSKMTKEVKATMEKNLAYLKRVLEEKADKVSEDTLSSIQYSLERGLKEDPEVLNDFVQEVVAEILASDEPKEEETDKSTKGKLNRKNSKGKDTKTDKKKDTKTKDTKYKDTKKSEDESKSEKTKDTKKASKNNVGVKEIVVEFPKVLNTELGTFRFIGGEEVRNISDLADMMQDGAVFLIAMYWTKMQLKKYTYDSLGMGDPVTAFPDDLDLMQILYVNENRKAVISNSVYTEVAQVFLDDDFEYDKDSMNRYATGAEWALYIQVPDEGDEDTDEDEE